MVKGSFTNKVNSEPDFDLDFEVVCGWGNGIELFRALNNKGVSVQWKHSMCKMEVGEMNWPQLWPDLRECETMECGESGSHPQSLNLVKKRLPPSADTQQESDVSAEDFLLGVLLKGRNPFHYSGFLALNIVPNYILHMTSSLSVFGLDNFEQL